VPSPPPGHGANPVLVAVRFPVWASGSAFGVNEVARRHGDFAIAGAVVGAHVNGATVDRAAIALFGTGSTRLRAPDAETALVVSRVSELDLTEVGQFAARDLDPPDDLHASSGLRRRIAATVVARALGHALKEAGDG
jgi:carbon-monoxide dehydrogenase medium subunit